MIFYVVYGSHYSSAIIMTGYLVSYTTSDVPTNIIFFVFYLSVLLSLGVRRRRRLDYKLSWLSKEEKPRRRREKQPRPRVRNDSVQSP